MGVRRLRWSRAEQIVNEAAELFTLPVDDFEIVLRVSVAGPAQQQRFGVAANGRQWRAKLVRDIVASSARVSER